MLGVRTSRGREAFGNRQIVAEPEKQIAKLVMAAGGKPILPARFISARNNTGAMAIGRVAVIRHEADQIACLGLVDGSSCAFGAVAWTKP
jgi:hypothetical protein